MTTEWVLRDPAHGAVIWGFDSFAAARAWSRDFALVGFVAEPAPQAGAPIRPRPSTPSIRRTPRRWNLGCATRPSSFGGSARR